MRDYGKVHTTFWSSSTIRGLSESARALALYLLTSPHGTIAGVFRLPDGYACEDLQWSSERVSEGFAELFDKGFANRCETTKWVWITNHFEWNKPENPNQRKSAAKVAMSIPDECAWKLDFMRVSGDFLGIEWSVNSNRCETLSKPFANQEQEQEQNKEPPLPPKGGNQPKPRKTKAEKIGLADFLQTCRDAGEEAIPEDDAVFAYADRIGLPVEFVVLAWAWFKSRYADKQQAGIKGWRQTFRNAVEGNWPKFWFQADGGEWLLTTAGKQAQAARDADER